jgi:hypothetical protein
VVETINAGRARLEGNQDRLEDAVSLLKVAVEDAILDLSEIDKVSLPRSLAVSGTSALMRTRSRLVKDCRCVHKRKEDPNGPTLIQSNPKVPWQRESLQSNRARKAQQSEILRRIQILGTQKT